MKAVEGVRGGMAKHCTDFKEQHRFCILLKPEFYYSRCSALQYRLVRVGSGDGQLHRPENPNVKLNIMHEQKARFLKATGRKILEWSRTLNNTDICYF